MSNNPTEYTSRDIYLCSVLKACNIPLVRVENHQGKGFFVFKHSQKIEKIIADYHNGVLKLDAKTLFSVWKDLKSLAFSATENYQNGGIKYGNSNRL